MFTILLLYVGNGVLLFLIAIPLYLQKIPPNGLYGFRVAKTMRNPDLWYPVNRYCARWLMLSGLLNSLGAVVLFFIPGFSLDVYALSCLGLFIITFGVGMAYTIRYMNSL